MPGPQQQQSTQWFQRFQKISKCIFHEIWKVQREKFRGWTSREKDFGDAAAAERVEGVSVGLDGHVIAVLVHEQQTLKQLLLARYPWSQAPRAESEDRKLRHFGTACCEIKYRQTQTWCKLYQDCEGFECDLAPELHRAPPC